MRPLQAFLGALLLLGNTAASSDCIPPKQIDVDCVVIGAGYAGLAAAHQIRKLSNLTVHVVEAEDHVGGRVRNFDPASGAYDTYTDTVVEIGGTFVAPSHTALINLTKEVGLDIYNVSGAGGSGYSYNGHLRLPEFRAHFARENASEPAGLWPWWYWGVDTKSALQTSIFHTFKGSHTFIKPDDLKSAFDADTWAELEAAGKAMLAETDKIDCNKNSGYEKRCEDGAWFPQDSITFEAWIQTHLQHDEGRTVLRAMTRGMIVSCPHTVLILQHSPSTRCASVHTCAT
jgi:hypothetical protein